MDNGISATWYDLTPTGKQEYLDWLHTVHIPAMLARPGILWAAHVENVMSPEREAEIAGRLVHTDDASVPGGNQYLLLFGAANAHVFADPSPDEVMKTLPAESLRMLAMQSSPRSHIFVEVERVEGPESKSRAPGITPGPIIQLGTFNINALENEVELSTWYARSRLPWVGTLPGCVGARKLMSIAGWAKHAILYEFTSLDLVSQHFVDRTDWSRQVVQTLVHAPHSPSIGTRIWPASA